MDAESCGCPPTARAPGEGGRVHHVIVNVTDLARSRAFYAWLLPRVGYPGFSDFADSCGWFGTGGSFWIKRAAARFAGERFDKDRVGLCEIAFAARSRGEVDDLARALADRGARILDAPREYAYVPGYYAVFFTDPDGVKLELVFIPES